jgi:hypothetical protein
MIAEGRVFPDRVEYNALPWKYAAGHHSATFWAIPAGCGIRACDQETSC